MKKTHKIRTEQQENVKNSVGRLVFAGICILLQISWFLLLGMKLYEYSTVISIFSSILALSLSLRIYSRHGNAAFKMTWIVVLLAFPVLGLCLYTLFGHKEATMKVRKRFEEVDKELLPLMPQDEAVLSELESRDFAVANQCRYIKNYGGYPVYTNTDVEFYAEASDGFDAQLAALETAEKFIFMEYHAFEEAASFARLKDVLARKAAQGVEVRMLYDDVGSIGFIDKSFINRMAEIGVECRDFNPVVPILNVFMNNRDHRKITVIDGKVGFTGGYNMADEYFNITHPYGVWKDTGVKLTGDAVKSLTVTFLEMWNAMKKTDTDYEKYLPEIEYTAVQKGYVQPYADSPLDDECVGENVYLNLIKHAKHRLYVTTPYLIISDEMSRELGLAAKRGVDVRVFTPGIPDKKIIFKVTRSYYAGLVRQGVRIYEYTPGFLHAKQMLCDEECATVGTINLDYRSLYHHFENGVYLYQYDAIKDIAKDFDNLLSVADEVTEYYKSGRPAVLRGAQCVLRLFSPLL
ncbi:MAG: cardiolipin synthase [Roseburia sp.]|nr:cardiolipin synthase [Roseburia sp.]